MMTEDDVQSETFSLRKQLRNLNSAYLCNLIDTLLEKKPELYGVALEWFNEIQDSLQEDMESEQLSRNEGFLFEYWEDAREIITEFNRLGGGPDDKEDEAYDYLDSISDLVKEEEISTSAKLEFLDEAFEEYEAGNSGFEDRLMEIFFEICQTREEWEYLLEKLEKTPSKWDKERAMKIRKDKLHDDEAYLKERMSKLSSGRDYWDLVNFYMDRGNFEKALETAEEGILKGEGNCSDLFEYLSDHFVKKRDTANLESVINKALARKSNEKKMLDRLFEYYKSEGDYEKAKGALLRSFEFIGRNEYIKEYKRFREFLKDADWKTLEPEILSRAREKNYCDYLQICLDKGMKEEILEIILNEEPPRNIYGIPEERRFDEFAVQLTSDFPEKIIEYYWQKSLKTIPRGGRRNYSTVAGYLDRVKTIYTDILNDEEAWITRFTDLKTEFKKRPAFLDEVKHL